MITIDKLKTFGANTEEGLGRCMGSEPLYLRLVGTVPGSAEFDALSSAIAEGDLKKGFEAAHALKGVLGNLSLTPLFEEVSELTDYLRVSAQMDYAPLVESILSKRDQLKQLCE